jgi:formylglycine-generating enzyme required for sulfatase activity
MEGAWMGAKRIKAVIKLGLTLTAILVIVGLQSLAPPAKAQIDLERTERLQVEERFSSLVVRVLPQRGDGSAASSNQGFGIIVGRQGQDLIVATPRHVVFNEDHAHTETPNIRFHTDQFSNVPARRLDRISPDDDLAWLLVRAPANLTVGNVPVAAMDQLNLRHIWGLGMGEGWDVSSRGGSFDREDRLRRLLQLSGLDTIPGSSGGAVVTADGFVGMILRTTGRATVALPMQRIAELLPEFFPQSQPLLIPVTGRGSLPGSSHNAAPSPQRVPRPGDVFRDCAECPEMVVIPSGVFLMGSPPNESGRTDDEGPQRRVSIVSLAVGRFEVTFDEWDACVSQGACSGYKPDDSNWGRGKRPVINVSWYDTQAYVEWLSRKTGHSYRLLTEAEWEYAARARTTTAYATGTEISEHEARFSGVTSLKMQMQELSEFVERSSSEIDRARARAKRAVDELNRINPTNQPSAERATVLEQVAPGLFRAPSGPPFNLTPTARSPHDAAAIGGASTNPWMGTTMTGSFQPNGFGLHDMHGNVWEWVQDCYRTNYNGSPSNGAAVTDRPNCTSIQRGGAWVTEPKDVRVANRFRREPQDRSNISGFRLARRL